MKKYSTIFALTIRSIKLNFNQNKDDNNIYDSVNELSDMGIRTE